MAPWDGSALVVTGDGLKARRHAREIVAEMRWHGMIAPSLYARLADEFEDLVRSGDYAAWVAANQTPAPTGGTFGMAADPGPVWLDRSRLGRVTPETRWTPARGTRRGALLPGPAPRR